MLLQRDSRRAPAGSLPPPAPLYDLRTALGRRAEFFGPYDGDEVEPTPRGPVRLGTLVRRIVDRLAAQVAA